MIARHCCVLLVFVAACAEAPVAVDAGSVDATTSSADAADVGSSDDAAHPIVAPTLGVATLAQRPYMTGAPTGTLVSPSVTTRTSGSMFVASLARGTWSAAPDAPTDSFLNAYAEAEPRHAYADWPDSATALYAASSATGGAAHTFSMSWGDVGGSGDEVTISVVEVIGATRVEDVSWVERGRASTITSEPLTTSGPALLLAWWWGSGTVRPAGELHVAAPGDGFEIVPGATGLVSLGMGGYIQVAVAARTVASAGTYTVEWTTDDEGAQLYVVALASD